MKKKFLNCFGVICIISILVARFSVSAVADENIRECRHNQGDVVDWYIGYTILNDEVEIKYANIEYLPEESNIPRGEVDLPNEIFGYPVTSIGENAFGGRYDMWHITIPDTVTNIGDYAFYSCYSLHNTMTLSDKMTNIGNYAFYDCPDLIFNSIPNSLTNIGDYAFYNCSGLPDNIILPECLTNIGQGAFCQSYLESATILNREVTIGEDAFKSCKKDFVIYGYSGSTAEAYAKSNNITFSALEEPDIASGTYGDNLTWVLKANGVLTISGSGDMTDYEYETSPWFAYEDDIVSVVIEDGVTSIGMNAFNNCTNLVSITIPEGVTSIEKNAFSQCTDLVSIDFPQTLTVISDYAFYNCISLDSVIFPKKLTRIGYSAFSYCQSITSVSFPVSLTDIEGFVFSNCTELTSITVHEHISSIGYGAFNGCTGLKSVRILNREIIFGNYALPKSNANLVLYGYKDSTTEECANSNGISFEAIKEPVFSIDTISLLDVTYNPIPSVPTTAFFAEVAVTNIASSERATILIATYDTDGRMLDIDFLYANPQIGQTVTFGTQIKNTNGNVAKVKAFVISDLKSFNALAEAKEITKA